MILLCCDRWYVGWMFALILAAVNMTGMIMQTSVSVRACMISYHCQEYKKANNPRKRTIGGELQKGKFSFVCGIPSKIK